MPQVLNLRIQGLYTHPNPFSEVPQGALAVADNITIDRESIAEARRGYSQYGPVLANIEKLLVYRDKLLAHDGSSLYYDSDDAGTWVAFSGTYAEPCSPIQIQSAEMNRNFYFTSATGIQKLSAPDGSVQPERAGAPAALDLSCTEVAGTAIADNTAVAYRIVWGQRDANENLILGSPSARCIYRNSSGGDRAVELDFTIPEGITTSYFYQIYRSEPTLNSTDEPNDDLQLVIEKTVTGAEITAGNVVITDDTPEDLKGAFIYTASTQAGILQSNERPPLACDLTRFRQHMFYARTSREQSANITFLENPSGGDTIDIGALSYEAGVDFTVGAGIEETLDNFIRVVNRDAANTLYNLRKINNNTFQVSGRNFGVAAFTVSSSNVAVLESETSDNEDIPNRVYISRSGQPEAVPFTNFIDIGSRDQPILRILDVRDAVFVLKEDGIYRITGTGLENFIAEQHDSTINILGANTAVELSNQIFCMSNQGVVAISVSGVALVSRPIERTLLQLSQLSNFSNTAFAVDYDSDRKYILGVPSEDGDLNATEMFVYNTITQSWTKWLIPARTGIVNTRNDRLYLGRASDDQVIQERKTFTRFDHADDEFDVTIVSSSGFGVTVVDASSVVVGMTLQQDLNEAVVTAIDGNVLTVSLADLPWLMTTATVFTPIDVTLEWVEEPAGNPGVLKHWSELTFLFEDARFREILARFSSNFEPARVDTTLTAKSEGAWGLFPWGLVPWGGGLGGEQAIRTYFPKEITRANWVNLRLELSQAFTTFSLTGVSIITNFMSSRFR